MIELLIGLLILCIVVWLVFFILGQMPIDPNLKTIITVIVAVICLLVILNRVGLIGGL
jgi:hypothetical protein